METIHSHRKETARSASAVDIGFHGRRHNIIAFPILQWKVLITLQRGHMQQWSWSGTLECTGLTRTSDYILRLKQGRIFLLKVTSTELAANTLVTDVFQAQCPFLCDQEGSKTLHIKMSFPMYMYFSLLRRQFSFKLLRICTMKKKEFEHIVGSC